MKYLPDKVQTRRLARFKWEASHPVTWGVWVARSGRLPWLARRNLRRCLRGDRK